MSLRAQALVVSMVLGILAGPPTASSQSATAQVGALRGAAPPDATVGALRGAGPPDATVGALRASTSPNATIGALQGAIPPDATVGALRASTSPNATIGAFQGTVPPGAAMGALRAPLPPGTAITEQPTPLERARGEDSLANIFLLKGAIDDAESSMRTSEGIYQRELGPGHPDVAGLLESHAASLRQNGRDATAAEKETRAGKIRAKSPTGGPR